MKSKPLLLRCLIAFYTIVASVLFSAHAVAQTISAEPNVIVDTIKPTVTITAPKAGQKWSNSVFIVTGKARDNVAVTNVFVSLNGGDWGGATLTDNGSNWTQQVELVPGTNNLAAFAVDSSGHYSATNKVKLFYILPTSLTLSTNGRGSVTPYHDGSLLNLGFGYALKATAAIGSRFTGWTDGLGNPIVTNATLRFLMSSNASYIANFADIAKPTLTITSPAVTGAKWSNNVLFTVAGKCHDNVAVSNVMVSLNGADWQTAALDDPGSNWTQQVTLVPGTNTIVAFAVDTSGNVSLTKTVKVVFYPDTRFVFGTWNLVQLQTPAQVYFDDIGDLQGGDDFVVTTGTMTLYTNGTLGGTLGDPFTGSFVDNSNGTLTATIMTGDSTNDFTFFINPSKDTMTEGDTLFDDTDNFMEQVIALRAPDSLSTAQVAGSWHLLQCKTPAQMTGDNNSGLQGNSNFEARNGTLTLNANGTFTGTLTHTISGNYTVGPNGSVTLFPPASSGSSPIHLFINFNKNTMVVVDSLVDADDNYDEMVMAYRVPASLTVANVVGPWNMVLFTMPNQIFIDGNSNLQGGNSFDLEYGNLTFNANSTFTGLVGSDPVSGTFSVGLSGTVLIHANDGTNLTFHLNSAKNTMSEVDVQSDQQEMITAVRVSAD